MLPSPVAAASLGASAGGAPANERALELESAEVAIGLLDDGVTIAVGGRVSADREAVGLGTGAVLDAGAGKKAH